VPSNAREQALAFALTLLILTGRGAGAASRQVSRWNNTDSRRGGPSLLLAAGEATAGRVHSLPASPRLWR